MKKNIPTLIMCILLLSLNNNVKAQSKLIHYWHFNNLTGTYNLPNIPGIAADYSVLDTNKAKILFAKLPGTFFDSSYLDGYATVTADYDTINSRMGASASTALRTRNPSDSMQLFFYIPTTGYKNIVLKYACEKSNNGMTTQLFDYSTDSGSTWKTSGLPATSYTNTTTFSLISVAFTDTTVSNNAKLVFRVKFSGNNISTSGNNRFDNVTVEGDSIIVPTTAITNQAITPISAYTLYPNPVSSTLEVVSNVATTRSFVIYNETGRQVYNGKGENAQFTINTAALSTGNYFISIRENLSGKTSILRFAKK